MKFQTARASALLCCWLLFHQPSSAPAQFRVVVSAEAANDAAATAEPTATAQSAPADEASKPDNEEKQKQEQRKQKRLEKIKQLQFDRRPSSILKAWVEANSPEENEDEQPAAENAESDPDLQGPRKPVEAPRPLTDAQVEAALEKEFDEQLKQFQKTVTLGEWEQVKQFLAELDEEESKATYERLLDALRSGAAQSNIDPQLLSRMILDSADIDTIQAVLSSGGQGPGAGFIEKNFFTVPDIAGLIAAAPAELEDDALTKIGTIVRQMIAAGHDLEELIEHTQPREDDDVPNLLSRRQLAKLMFASGQDVRGGDFLPKLEVAESEHDVEALNLLSRHLLALYTKEKKTAILEQAWSATQSVLAADDLDELPTEDEPADDQTDEERQEERKKRKERADKQKQEALKRAVELAPRLRDELGQRWLDESFTTRIDRGREILATIGTAVSKSLQSRPQDPKYRLGAIKLQRTAVEALVAAAPETATDWTETLSLLAGNWLKESNVSYRFDRNSRGRRWQRDRYGNFYYLDDNAEQPSVYRYQGNSVRAITTRELLDARPSDRWLELVDEGLRPEFAGAFSKLLLKVNEETQAFPYIEQLAVTHAERARDLAHEFLRVWTRNHNPNESRDQYQPYIYYWGYRSRAERIPLTRSKQVRNLKELAGWVEKLRALPIEPLDEKLLTKAFTTSHSAAEVYRLDSIEKVFGSIDSLEPETLAELIQQMRGNLTGVWRQPDVQKQNSTNRKQKDIQTEVLQGYRVAKEVVQQGLEQHTDHWALLLVEAAIMHDENDYQQEIEQTSEYSERRTAALAKFRQSAESYGRGVGDITEDKESSQVYEQWFYASLGAVDLAGITDDKVPDPKQPALIREAILALPPDVSERHMDKFANNLFTRLSNAKAELKFRYLRNGFEIVGDNKLAREARKVLDYYQDLVTEIAFETKLDGDDVVGHTEPFGVFVNIRHTKEIERESGGFGRYLQNQNNRGYYYNYGRPTEDYRDKFSEVATQALDEQFEVLSITFQDPEVNSRALPEYGWRYTPYAYLLLKARGPEVDKLPPLHLNLDFMDTSGYAIIPVESPALPLDARPDTTLPRPVADVTITQTLDERQADEGKLLLEIKATAHGLVPNYGESVELEAADFEVVNVEDEGVSVSEFDKEADGTTITSERLWVVTLQAKENLPERPKEFQFASAKLPVEEMLYQRYDDADLIEATELISLEQSYGDPNNNVLWVSLATLLGVVGLGFVLRYALRRRVPVAEARFQVPEQVTPFTVLGVLRDIQHNNGLEADRRTELAESISRLERHYFQGSETSEPDLLEIVRTWVDRARA